MKPETTTSLPANFRRGCGDLPANFRKPRHVVDNDDSSVFPSSTSTSTDDLPTVDDPNCNTVQQSHVNNNSSNNNNNVAFEPRTRSSKEFPKNIAHLRKSTSAGRTLETLPESSPVNFHPVQTCLKAKKPNLGSSSKQKHIKVSKNDLQNKKLQPSPWLTTTATSSAAEQPLASLPPMATHDRRLGSPVMARKPKRRQQALGHSANLQICFMPDDLLDDDDLVSTTSATMASCDRLSAGPGIDGLDVRLPSPVQPKSLPASSGNAAGSVANGRQKCVDDSAQQDDFWRKQARLQAEARVALAQACHMAKMQMEVERQRKKNSPISDMISLPVSCSGHRRLSRSLLTRINLEELNAIQTSLIMEVKKLNEQLVTNLMMRDELHMEQDSMLVDLEDLTRYLSAKEEILRVRGPPMNHNKTEAIKMQSKQNNKFSLKSLVKF